MAHPNIQMCVCATHKLIERINKKCKKWGNNGRCNGGETAIWSNAKRITVL